MPDHDVIFSQLATELNNQITPFVALLRSKDCTGSVHFSYNPLLLVSLFLAATGVRESFRMQEVSRLIIFRALTIQTEYK